MKKKKRFLSIAWDLKNLIGVSINFSPFPFHFVEKYTGFKEFWQDQYFSEKLTLSFTQFLSKIKIVQEYIWGLLEDSFITLKKIFWFWRFFILRKHLLWWLKWFNLHNFCSCYGSRVTCCTSDASLCKN